MKIPLFKDVRLPMGSIPPNWPLLLGVALSVVVLVGLLMTGEEVVEEDDPLDPARPELGEVEAMDPRLLVDGDIDAQAERRRAEQLEAERRRLQDAERIRREANEAARARAAQLARAEEQLAALRQRQLQPAQPEAPETPLDLLARTADEADLLETLRLEDIARRAEALRAPMVVSSARGIGERQHALRTVAAAQLPGGAVDTGGLQPGLGAGGAAPVLSAAAPAAAPALGPQGFSPAPAQGPPPSGSFYDDPPAGSPAVWGAPQAASGRGRSAGGGQPGTFTAGPAADGGTGGVGPAGVVVTPHDGRDYRLYEGTMLPAVLQTQLDGTASGPLSAQVTRHVYSADRQRVLVPRGTVALGTSQGVQDLWQGRLAIGFHRLIFPDGRWVRMEFAGMNGLGETSLRDQVDRHYLQMFAAAGGVGLLAGFAQAGGGGQSQFRSAVSEQMANTSLQIVSQFLNRLPEVTIRAGHRVNIRLMEDLVVPAEAAWDVD
ncbi:MAG: TrbI/VirB10 family protein [Acidobacteria bacterium]|nr:TrbI/VirB10 family protein [Acidobacteriota bacterium]